MKKNIYLSLLFFTLAMPVIAQQPWAQTGATWYYTDNDIIWGWAGYNKVEKLGDTLFNGFNCDNLLSTRHIFNYPTSQFYDDTTHEYTYISNDTLYWWKNNQFVLLANYAAGPGETWLIPDAGNCIDSNYFQVDSVGQMIIGIDTLSVHYLTAHIQFMNPQVRLIEKIGYDLTMFPYWNCQLDYSMNGPLRCYNDSTGLNYSNGFGHECEYTTSVNEINSKEQLKIYPNPSTKYITVSTNKEKGELILLDFLGKQIMQKTVKSEWQISFDVSSLATGIYLLQFNTEKGKYTAKLVKE